MAAPDPTAPDPATPHELESLTGADATAVSIAVARRYYLEDQSKVAIGRAFGLSRFQVAKLLRNARREGLVRVEIGAPGRRDREAEAALAQALALERVVVVSGQPGSPRSGLEFVGRALAQVVADEVGEGDVLGVTWSRPAAIMAQNLAPLPRCTVVGLGGAIYPPVGIPGSVEVIRAIGAGDPASAFPIYAPLVVVDAQTATGLRAQPEIARCLERFATIDVAVLSVGAWMPSASAVFDLLPVRDSRALSKAGACGEISGRLFDADGRPLAGLDERVIGADLAALRRVPRLVTASYGGYRAAATRAAIAAGLVHTLVVDDELARALLVEPARSPS